MCDTDCILITKSLVCAISPWVAGTQLLYYCIPHMCNQIGKNWGFAPNPYLPCWMYLCERIQFTLHLPITLISVYVIQGTGSLLNLECVQLL